MDLCINFIGLYSHNAVYLFEIIGNSFFRPNQVFCRFNNGFIVVKCGNEQCFNCFPRQMERIKKFMFLHMFWGVIDVCPVSFFQLMGYILFRVNFYEYKL